MTEVFLYVTSAEGIVMIVLCALGVVGLVLGNALKESCLEEEARQREQAASGG